MVKLLVLYDHPQDPVVFDKYYQEVLIPIAKQMQGLKKWTIGKLLGTPDGQPSPYDFVAELYMETRADFDVLFASPEGQSAVADVPKFATGGVTFLFTEVQEIV